jgi:hypothetical protein
VYSGIEGKLNVGFVVVAAGLDRFQAALSLHRTRDLLVKLRTQLTNKIRGLLAEFGVDIQQFQMGRNRLLRGAGRVGSRNYN